MSDYIEREDALKAVDAFIGTDPIADRIKLIPPADAAPIRHGRWEDDGEEGWWCSECGFETRLRWDYCPDCGANMIGGDD